MLVHRSLVLVALLGEFLPGQIVWNQRYPSQSPPGRSRLAMAYDEARQVTVVFGGVQIYPNFLADTWEWSGMTQSWTQRMVPGPPPMKDVAMAYHAGAQHMVLVGKEDQNNTSQVWLWDGAAWSQRPAPMAARDWPAMAYDRVRDEVVLFGGQYLKVFGDTWVWDGNTWTQRMPSHVPPPTYQATMAWDAASGRVLMFGGVTNTTGPQNATWAWDGTDWALLQPRNSPPFSQRHAMATDTLHGRIVLVTPTSPFVWDWDGTNWSTESGTPPVVSTFPGLAYDSACGRVVMFGGDYSLDDTWERYDMEPASYERFGKGCPGTAGPLTLTPNTRPWFCGPTFSLTLAPLAAGAMPFGVLGDSRTMLGDIPLPLSLARLGAPGCQVLVSTNVLVPLVANGGSATWTVTFPSLPSLVGGSFYLQGLAVDPGANAAGLATSDAGTATIGAQ